MDPRQGKTPKTPASIPLQAVAVDDQAFQWTAHEIDHAYSGSWDWNLSPKETADLLDLLATTSRLKWREVKALEVHSKKRTRRLHHSQSVDSICRDAQKRLDDLGRGDQESVFRLRHGNTVRVWGVLEGPVFSILWFDREHKIYPID